jgi:peptide subunit release factor 1 (eRF1)
VQAIHDEARGTLLEEPDFEDALRLLASHHDENGVLSVYLDIDPALAGREGYEAILIGLWKPVASRLQDAGLLGRLEYEIAGVTDEVRSWAQPPGRSVAMFFGSASGLRAVIPLRFPMRSMARFEPRPVLAPLIAALDEHRRYGVVMFDKAHARLITVFLGAVEEEITLQADIVARTDVGGWGGYLQSRYARHREHHLAAHARRTIEHLWAIDRSRPMHGVILSGPEEPLAVLRRMLPKALARSVVATVSLDMSMPVDQVLERVTDIDAAARLHEDEGTVARIAEEASVPGGLATVGWDDTLQALGEGRVHMVVLPQGAKAAGVECPQEHFLAVSPIERCPLCGERLLVSEDVVETAIRAAMHTDALVHFVAGPPGGLLGRYGVVALLRF